MIKTNDSHIAPAAAEGGTPLTPEQLVEQLRLLRQHVPDFGPLPKASRTLLHAAARVHAEFVQSSINTIGASPILAQAVASDAPTLIDERKEVDRWSAVEDELRTMLNGVAAANLARRHRIGLAALQTYNIARQLVRKKEYADLLPHVENMRRTNRLGRKRSTPTPETPQTPTTPPPVTPKA